MPPGVEKKVHPTIVTVVLEGVWGGIDKSVPGKCLGGPWGLVDRDLTVN